RSDTFGNRFNGFSPCLPPLARLHLSHVSPFLLSCLGASRLGDTATPTLARQGRGGEAICLPHSLCPREKRLYENQFREPGPRPCAGGLANGLINRGDDAVFQRRLLTLDKPKRIGAGEIR